jgi:ribonuclease HI
LANNALDAYAKTLPDVTVTGRANYNVKRGIESADKRLAAENAIWNYLSKVEHNHAKIAAETIKANSRAENKNRLEQAASSGATTIELFDDKGTSTTFYKRGKGWSVKPPNKDMNENGGVKASTSTQTILSSF